MKSKSGQAAVEVLAYASFFLLVFAAIAAVFLQLQSQELSRAESAYAQQIAYGLADNVHTAFIAGPGFSQEVALPLKLLGKDYSIRVSSSTLPLSQPVQSGVGETGFVYVDWQGTADTQTFSVPSVTSAFRATESRPFISIDGNFIEIDASKCQRLNISSVTDSSGNDEILFEKGSGCP